MRLERSLGHIESLNVVEPSLQMGSSGLLDGTNGRVVASNGAPNGSIAETKLGAGKVGTIGEVVIESVQDGGDVLERAGRGQKGRERRERDLELFQHYYFNGL